MCPVGMILTRFVLGEGGFSLPRRGGWGRQDPLSPSEARASPRDLEAEAGGSRQRVPI